MKFTEKAFLIATITAALAAPVFAHDNGEKENDHEEKVEWNSVPAPVQATIKSNSAGGQIVSVEKETEKDAVEYEAKVKGPDGKMSEVKVSESGTLIGVKAEDEDDKDGEKDKGED
ncbi:MAG: PepSY domain-containing protein [Chthoniobacterales bacterium]